MKKVVTAVVSGALALSVLLAGCSSQNASSPDRAAQEEAAQEEATQEEASSTEGVGEQLIVGGWTVNTEVNPSLSKNQKAIFDKAIKNMLGVSYKPVCELATQVVAGTNHAFLAKGLTATEEPKETWYIVKVYEDLDGGATVSLITEIDISKLQFSSEAMPANLMGGWTVSEQPESELLPKEAADAFAKASKNYKDAKLQPLATLATQLVSGTNYVVLCSGTGANDGARSLFVATVYADLKGNAEFTSVEYFNLMPYVSAA